MRTGGSCFRVLTYTRARRNIRYTRAYTCLHELYPRVFLKEEVLHVLAELNTVEIAGIACAPITTRDFH